MKCKCGCGEIVKPGNEFIIGHNRRKHLDNSLIVTMYTRELLSANEIADKLQIGAATVRRILEKNKVVRRSLKEAAKLVVAKGKNFLQTPKGRKHHSLIMKGHSFNRIFDYDRAFFSSWNSKMAYILGLIAADGCVYRNRVILSLKDSDLLQKIASVVGKKAVISRNGYHHLIYSSHEMTKDLARLGIKPRKTFSLAPIKIPAKHISHFVRGFFDGDGCFAYNRRTTTWISAITNASLPFLKWLHKNLQVKGGTIRKRTATCYELRFGELDSYNLGMFLYGEMSQNDIYLERKKLLFEQIRKVVESKGGGVYERCYFGRR